MSEIFLTSGNLTIIGEAETLIQNMKLILFKDFQKAFKDAVKDAMLFVKTAVEPKIAKDRDLMRIAFMNALETTTTRGNSNLEVEFNFNMARFIENVRDPVSDIKYAKFHIRDHPLFKFALGYMRPTTPGTKPISFKFWERVEKILSAKLHSNLILAGYGV